MIEYIQEHVIYENPIPHVRSRHGYFPGVVQLSSGELVALFVIGEAFESVDLATHVSRSSDRGQTWQLQGPLYDKSEDSVPISDMLKPQILRDGTLIALGYCFERHDPEQSLAIPETDGILPGDEIVSFSSDDGRHWTVPCVFPRSMPELLEIPNRSVQLRSGDIVATAGLFKMPDGTNPSGQFGVLLRSTDNGKTWDDSVHFFESPTRSIAAYESHICEMQDGRLVAICWAYDAAARKDLPNQVTVSHDNGYTWSDPIDTGHLAQSSSLLWLGGERLMSIHCHRGDEVGLYVRVIDFTNDQWNVVSERNIWGAAIGQESSAGQKFHELARALRFGQASLLKLDNGEFLAIHWAVVNGQGMILSHRLRLCD